VADDMSILWSPCCDIIRFTDNKSTVHSGLCRTRHNGVLGPTIRLVPHPDDRYNLAVWQELNSEEARRG
jgi:hypothetical protein